MKTEDFNIQVPREMIAQEPVEPRDSSKLMVLYRKTGTTSHHTFSDLPDILGPNDVLVFNDSRVIPARLRGNKGNNPMEEVVVLLLNKHKDENMWDALVEVGEVQRDDTVDFKGLTGFINSVGEKIGKRSEKLVNIILSDESKLEKAGEPPVPPYIHGYKGNPERYQTVYSRVRGSAAAPTAGLHFTERLIEELDHNGVEMYFVTLHVGIDTFMPVMEQTPEEHKIYTEFCQVSEEVANSINKAREKGKKIIGVGTTSIRTMESAHSNGRLHKYDGWTSIYILPGYNFKSIDGMITNYHYPKSTNIMMVSAFAGYDNVKKAYQEAVESNYRFYSFGDAMLII